jgi:hypothetical protein
MMLHRNPQSSSYQGRRLRVGEEIRWRVSNRYFNEIMEYIELKPEKFHDYAMHSGLHIYGERRMVSGR